MGKSSFLQDFKSFAMKGNVIDMAVGVIIGGAFGKDVDGAAASLLNQWIGAGLLEKSQDTYCPTVAGMFWHVTMAQFLVNVISKRL